MHSLVYNFIQLHQRYKSVYIHDKNIKESFSEWKDIEQCRRKYDCILLNILVNARIVFLTHEFNPRFLYKMSMNVIMLNVHVYNKK